MFKWVRLRIDGRQMAAAASGDAQRLSGLLRSLGKTMPGAECAAGECGACTVLVGDRPVRSCALLTEGCGGLEVETAESLDLGPEPHPMLVAFRRHGVQRCGICMPGLLVAAVAYAARDRELTEDEIESDLIADVCRCGRSPVIAAAILEGSRLMHGPREPADEAGP